MKQIKNIHKISFGDLSKNHNLVHSIFLKSSKNKESYELYVSRTMKC